MNADEAKNKAIAALNLFDTYGMGVPSYDYLEMSRFVLNAIGTLEKMAESEDAYHVGTQTMQDVARVFLERKVTKVERSGD